MRSSTFITFECKPATPFGYTDNSSKSQTDFFPASTTILRMPTWLGRDVTQDHPLPHALGDYKATPGVGAERWTVSLLKTGEIVYSGLGPVEFLRERAAA